MAGLSCSIADLLEKLESFLELNRFKQDTVFIKNLKRLGSALKSISEVVTDAERKQDTYVKRWLLKLKDAVYDAEDLLDEIFYEATRSKLEAKSHNLKSWARALAASIRRNLNQIHLILEILHLAKDEYKFGFSQLEAHNELPLSKSDNLPVSTSLLDETAIYGRKEDRGAVVRLLLSGDENLREEDRGNVVRFVRSGDENFDAIALVGEGGVGKTTLAQLVYKDEKVSEHFKLKAWIDVGIDFDVHRICRKILEAATFLSFEGYGLDKLQGKVSGILAGEKFLLVLEDVRIGDISSWNALKSSLRSGARGSKIIVTSNSDDVATVFGCSICYHLHPLKVEDCWSILENSAFAGRDRSEAESLEDIGRKIVEQCNGLPLFVRAIEGLLRFKKTREEWHDVLEGLKQLECLKIESSGTKNGDSISPILWLSYYHLPARLKRCFAYCSLFPKDYEFDKEELVPFWMAEGFLQQSTAQSVETAGAECFNGLLKRSFFIPGDNSRFKMHDLMHDLAEHVSERDCFRLESRFSNTSAIPERTRHLSLLISQRDKADSLSAGRKTKKLRTFYLINSPSGHGSCQLSPEELKVILAIQKRLRVLSLPHFQHAELPASIGKLKHLRYLDVSDSALKRLPKSLCTLYHLQTLILTNCSSLHMLPQGMVKLVQLRKLNIERTGLKQMPEEIGRLRSLQSLSNFIVGHGGSGIKELGALPDLHGSLSISMLQNVSSVSDALAANLKAMLYLDELDLEWSNDNEDCAADQEEVLENLKPSGELKKLSIRFYGGTVFPNWLGDSSSLNVTSLHLGDCRNIELLPPLGQLPLLKHLIIESFSGIKCIGHEFYGVAVSGCKPFQFLKTLEFRDMSGWEKWKLLEAEGEEFPRLEEFYIINCPVFRGYLPTSLPSLKKLKIAKCEKLGLLPRTSEHRVRVLELAKPSIGSYGDKVFLKLLETFTFSYMTFLCLSDINNFSSLPPLGQLPFLRSLIIRRIGGVRSIGSEFFYMLGLPFRKPFQSLRTLKFEVMSQWERWTPVEVEGEEYPWLEEFYVINCPKLKGDLPKCLPSLIILEISECQQLAAVLPLTSEHCVLKLENCDKVQKRSDENPTVAPQSTPSIMHPEQDDNQKEASSSEDGDQQFSSSLSLNFSGIGMEQLKELPTDLQSLRIERYTSDRLSKEILERSSLQHLYIINCILLESFHLSSSLKTLYIHNCKNLVFPQPDKVMKQPLRVEDLCLGSSCDSLEKFPLNYFPKLKTLSLWDCRNLKCLSIKKELQTELSSLDSLEIKDCPNLRSFLEEEFQAPKLTSLVFFNCGSLESLQRMQSFESLRSLYINKCPALVSLPEEGLPSSLVILCVSFCDKITPQKEWKLYKLHSLSRFEIEGGCQNLKSFPEVGLLPTNLNFLRISKLLNLTSLDKKGLQKLTSLQTLEIDCCNKLDSLSEHRLPSTLSSLSITDCSLLNPKLQNRKGKEWLKIAHIPSIYLDEVSD